MKTEPNKTASLEKWSSSSTDRNEEGTATVVVSPPSSASCNTKTKNNDGSNEENATGEAEIVTGPSGEPVQSALFLCQQKTCSKTGKMTLERWSGWVHKERAFCLVPKEFGKTDAQQRYIFPFCVKHNECIEKYSY